MKRIQTLSLITALSIGLNGCNSNEQKADGYGNFEAREVTISAESNGKLLSFTAEEGKELTTGTLVGYIDSTALALKKQQLLVSKELIQTKSEAVLSQIDVLEAQLKTALTNLDRISQMFKDKAATAKQMDDAQGHVDVLRQQIRSIKTQNASVLSELKSLDIQILQLQDQIQKCRIINPEKGTVLSKYAEENELVSYGKPLYKMARLDKMVLKVYVSETQLTSLSIGQKVKVLADAGEEIKSYEGTISHIASEAEFTPKIIQTKEERVTLVYAVKVDVSNDGSLKIGMPGEMRLE